MKSREIINCAISGVRLDLSDVARVSHDRRLITLRRAWPEHCDSRVWDAIRNAYVSGTQKIANDTLRQVTVYDPRGWVLEVIEPDFEAP